MLRHALFYKIYIHSCRFEKVAECCDNNHLAITFRIGSHLLSHDTMYACYLVFKLPENASVFEGVVVTSFHVRSMKDLHTARHHIYLVTPPHTPIIELSPGQKPSRSRKIKGHPKLRKDGWMEIQMWEFLFSSQLELDSWYKSFWKDGFVIDGYLKSLDKWNFTGLIVEGIELRPAKVHFEPISM
ncbi:putative phloem protein [Helianthus anomalus]